LFVSQITQSWRGLGLVLPGVDPDHGLTVGVAGRCLKWVNLVVLAEHGSLPVFPDERTFSDTVGMSQMCQQRTSSDAQEAATRASFSRRRNLASDMAAV
jgi:hypothetical protein